MINSNPSPRLVKHIIRSYARLAENSRVRAILRENLPQILKEKHFFMSLDDSSRKWLSTLSKSLASTQINERIPINGINTNITGINQMADVNNHNGLNSFAFNQNDLIGNGYNYNSYDYLDGYKAYNYTINSNNMNHMGNQSSAKSYLNFNAGPFNQKNGK